MWAAHTIRTLYCFKEVMRCRAAERRVILRSGRAPLVSEKKFRLERTNSNRIKRNPVRKYHLSTYAPRLRCLRALLPLASLPRLRYEHTGVSTRTLPLHARQRTCPSPGFARPFLGVGISQE